MTILLQDAKDHLNIDGTDDNTELTFFVNAANEWVATQVSDTSPYPVQLATRELVRHWWDSQRGPAAGPLDPDAGFTLGALGFAIPSRVKEMLGPYLTSTATAAPVGSFPNAMSWPDTIGCPW